MIVEKVEGTDWIYKVFITQEERELLKKRCDIDSCNPCILLNQGL